MRKRILCLLCSILIAVQICPSVFAKTQNDSENSVIDVLKDLNIWVSYNTDEFRADRLMYRSEYIKSILNILSENTSTDINISKEQAEFAQSLNIIADADNIDAQRPIKLEEAAKVSVNALGYKELADKKGGYPYGHLYVANMLSLLNGINADKDGYLTRQDAAVLIYRTLNASPFVEEAYDGNGNVIGKAFGNETLISYYINKIYLSSYTDFDEIEMPKAYSSTAYYYDFKQFNDGILIDFQKFITQNVKRYAPNIRIHYKTMVSNGYSEMKSFMGMGDLILEETAALSDVFGCDAYACYTRANQPVQGKIMAYRYMMSIADKPIVNSEDHIMPDKFKNFDRKTALFNATDMWNSAIYGRSQSIIWLYARTYNTASYRYCALLQRPDCISKIGKASLDLQRLSNEVSALLNAKSDAGILFSQTSRMYNLSSMNTAYNIFTSLLNIGKKAEFIPESQIKKINDYKILFIPGSTHITKETLNEIYNYSKNGGKVVIFNDNSFKYSEQNILHDENTVSEIYKNAAVYKTSVADSGIVLLSPSYEEFSDAVRENCINAGLSDLKIVNKDTGEIVKSAAAEMCQYEGSYIVNLTDYDWEDKNITLVIDGKNVEQCYDLIAMEELKDGFVLNGYTPRLIKIAK